MYKPLKMFGASSNINPYSGGGHGGNSHGAHAGHTGHSHGDHTGHGHSHGPGESCGTTHEDKPGDFPAPGPLNKPKAQPAKPARPGVETMSIVQVVQYGEIGKLKEFVDNGTDIRKPDDENVTLLHWAAINNRIEIIKYLITNGATVDQKGGNLDATPLHWAVRQGLLNMVVLLMKYGANPHSVDNEGCTCLHVACQLSQTAIVAYLIAKGMDVDLLDSNGMTPLMWVAYRSFGVDTMRLLLTMGASLNRRDKFHKNTALHWAVISSNNNGLSALCKASADTTITNEKGETALDLAGQKKSGWMMTQLQYLNLEKGREQPSWLRNISTNKTLRSRIMFWLPFYFMFTMAGILEWSQGWTLALMVLATILITWGFLRLFYSYDMNSNRLALGVAIATKLLTYIVWYFNLLEYCSFFFILTFAGFSVTLFYSFYKTWKNDPGVLTTTQGERKRVIVELAEKGSLDFKNFCSTCLIRKPVRSKHCSVCDRCIARMDHHCPWVDNCIGVGNHAMFIIYLSSVTVCFCYFTYNAFVYFNTKCSAFDNGVLAGVTAMFQCSGMVSWVVSVGIFFTFWVFALLVSQCHQVFMKGMTTNEVINAPRYQHFFSNTKDGMPNSPFSRGILRNMADFFECSFCGLVKPVIIDWRTEYSFDQLNRNKHTV